MAKKIEEKKPDTKAIIGEIVGEDDPGNTPDPAVVTDVAIVEKQLSLTGQIKLNSIQDVMLLADVFIKSGLFRDTTDTAQAVIKILAGQELGLPPVYSMMNFYILRGKIGTQASVIASLIKRSKQYDYRIKMWDTEKCSIDFFEYGKLVLTSTFTIEDAKRADLVKPDSGWVKYPRDLLFARALTQGGRKVAPELLMNLYTREELESIAAPDESPASKSPQNPSPPAESGTAVKATFRVPPAKTQPAEAPPPKEEVPDNTDKPGVSAHFEEEGEQTPHAPNHWEELMESCPLHGEPWKTNKWDKKYHFVDSANKKDDKFCNLSTFITQEKDKLMKAKGWKKDELDKIVNELYSGTWSKIKETEMIIVLAMIENGEYDKPKAKG